MDFLDNDLPCRREDPELFFPVGAGAPAARQIEAAKAVCRRCPVTAQCLAYALDGQDYGVWGGHSEQERRAFTRRRSVRRHRGAHGDQPAAGPRPGECSRSASTAERRRAARHAIDVTGRARPTVAAAFGVSIRTLDRWLATERAHTSSDEATHPQHSTARTA